MYWFVHSLIIKCLALLVLTIDMLVLTIDMLVFTGVSMTANALL